MTIDTKCDYNNSINNDDDIVILHSFSSSSTYYYVFYLFNFPPKLLSHCEFCELFGNFRCHQAPVLGVKEDWLHGDRQELAANQER